MGTVLIELPGGVVDDAGQRHQQAVVRALSGHEEELLAGAGAAAARLATIVLGRCVERIGTLCVTEELIRSLTVGDRQVLLMGLRQATFGPWVAAVVRCPWPDCGEQMDIGFSIPDIPVRPAGDPGADHEVTLPDAGAVLRFRLPTGADQEAIGAWAADDPLGALEALLHRCVPGAESAGLRPGDRAAIERAMLTASFGPELSFGARCPECARSFTLPFDVQDFFFGEVTCTPDLLLREVHQLALNYHWSEQDILTLSRDRRQRYLALLATEIGGRADAVV